jgi:phospholipase/lecithinase/hemolysin
MSTFSLWCRVLVLAGALTGVTAQAGPWKQLFVFGDSYSDSGAGYVDGNGPTAVVYLARHLDIPFTHANDPARAGQGLNFAVSGARTGSGDGRRTKDALLGRGMRNQVQDFVARVRQGEVKFDPATTLFFIAGGLNDGRVATEATITNLKEEIAELHGVGARSFALALLPVRIPAFSAVGRRLNPALAELATTLQLEGATIRVSQWGRFFDEVMENPSAYGITNTTDACAGRALFEQDPTPQGDPKTFYYYHAGHPSTAVHQVVGEKLAREVLGEPRP